MRIRLTKVGNHAVEYREDLGQVPDLIGADGMVVACSLG